jgi:hypothetical protein
MKQESIRQQNNDDALPRFGHKKTHSEVVKSNPKNHENPSNFD